MHPEIEKFWQRKGIKIKYCSDGDYWYYKTQNSGKNRIGLASHFRNNSIIYYFNNKTFEEKDMLKIIRLVVFV